MIPALSVPAVPSAYLYRQRRRTIPLVDFEMGSGALGDGSLGMEYQLWQSAYVDGSIVVGPVGGTLVPILAVPDVVRTALAFDLNMRTYLAYTVGTGSFFHWYDTLSNSMATLPLPGSTDVCLTLDDHREVSSNTSDIIVSYSRNGQLYCRVQRERFQTEHLLTSDMQGSAIINMGMTIANRLEWRILP